MSQATPMSLVRALDVLGLSGSITPEQIREAFTQKVKLTADQQGGYNGDMRDVSKAKELLLAEYEKQCPGSLDAYRARSEAARKHHLRQPQVSMDAIRTRAQREEEEEDRQRRAREARLAQREREEVHAIKSEGQATEPIEEAHMDTSPSQQQHGEDAQAQDHDLESQDSDSIQAALLLIAEQARQRADKMECREQTAIKAALCIEEELLAIERSVQNIRAALDQLMC